MPAVDALPPVTLSYTDYNDLVFALRFARDREAAILLEQELHRAALCCPDDLPDEVVALNSRVIFRFGDDAAVHARLLVHPANHLCPHTEVSALSPVGAALLGLRPGDVMPFTARGRRREVTIEGLGMRFAGPGAPRLRRAEAPIRIRAGAAAGGRQHAVNTNERSNDHG